MAIAARLRTYEDLLQTPEADGNRYELLGGEILVTASPARKHVWLVNLIAFELTAFVRGQGIGDVFTGPVDVRLSVHDVVVPDIIYISAERSAIFGEQSVQGPPDLIVEVLSRSTRARDTTQKLRLYAQTGVPEYWIVDPETSAITVYGLVQAGSYEPIEPIDGKVRSRVVSGFGLDAAKLFANIP